jgi:hypothetical protein
LALTERYVNDGAPGAALPGLSGGRGSHRMLRVLARPVAEKRRSAMLDYVPPQATPDRPAPARFPAPHGYRVMLPLAAGMRPRVCARIRRWMMERSRAPHTDAARITERLEGRIPRTLELLRRTEDFTEKVWASTELGQSGNTVVRVRRVIVPCWAPDAETNPKLVDPRTYRAPSLVPSLVREFGARRDRPLILRSRVCDMEDTASLITYLQDLGREMPALVVSPMAERSRPCFPVEKLAESVVGLAHVFTLADGWCAELLGEVLGERFACCGGSVRIYWPGLRAAGPEIEELWHPHLLWSMQAGFRIAVLQALGMWWRAEECEANERRATS